jgi:hypothetical protein
MSDIADPAHDEVHIAIDNRGSVDLTKVLLSPSSIGFISNASAPFRFLVHAQQSQAVTNGGIIGRIVAAPFVGGYTVGVEASEDRQSQLDRLHSSPLTYTGEVGRQIAEAARNRPPLRGTIPPLT